MRVLVTEKPRTNEIVGYVTVEFKWKSLVKLSIITLHDYLTTGVIYEDRSSRQRMATKSIN